MKFKERLWQLFLAIVLGVTLSVCDAGLQDDELESSALIAGSAIAAGVTSGDGYVKIGDFMILSGEKYISNTMSLTIRPQSECKYDLISLGEIMLRLDPGEGRIRTARDFKAWEGGGEYNAP